MACYQLPSFELTFECHCNWQEEVDWFEAVAFEPDEVDDTVACHRHQEGVVDLTLMETREESQKEKKKEKK